MTVPSITVKPLIIGIDRVYIITIPVSYSFLDIEAILEVASYLIFGLGSRNRWIIFTKKTNEWCVSTYAQNVNERLTRHISEVHRIDVTDYWTWERL